MSVQNVKRILLGTPIPTAHAAHERLGPLTGLAIFASDALSSVAYATEEILLILVLGGAAALLVQPERTQRADRHPQQRLGHPAGIHDPLQHTADSTGPDRRLATLTPRP